MGNNNHIAYLLATYLQWNYNIENMTISVKFIKILENFYFPIISNKC